MTEKTALEELAEIEAQDAPPADPPPEEAPPPEQQAALEADDAQDDPPEEAPEAAAEDEAFARKLGWKPKEDWKGDTSGWVPAGEFLERATRTASTVDRLKAEMDEMRAQQDRQLAAMRRKMEEDRDRDIKAAEARLAAAKETLDADAIEEAAAERARLQAQPVERQDGGPRPSQEGAAWLDRNPQVRDRPALRQLAANYCQEAIGKGIADMAGQLDYAEMMLKREFPEAMGTANGAAKQDKPQRAAAPVDGGGLTQPRRAPGLKWDDLAPEDRAFYAEEIERGTWKDRAAALKAHEATYGG